jgi:hypothetical protein
MEIRDAGDAKTMPLITGLRHRVGRHRQKTTIGYGNANALRPAIGQQDSLKKQRRISFFHLVGSRNDF